MKRNIVISVIALIVSIVLGTLHAPGDAAALGIALRFGAAFAMIVCVAFICIIAKDVDIDIPEQKTPEPRTVVMKTAGGNGNVNRVA